MEPEKSEKFLIPIKLESESNLSEHWTKKAKRKKKQWQFVQFVLNRCKIKPPCKVLLTRIAPRDLDADDNLRAAFKTVKDAVADHILPGMEPGRADGDERIQWFYAQKKGFPRYYAVEIEIFPVVKNEH